MFFRQIEEIDDESYVVAEDILPSTQIRIPKNVEDRVSDFRRVRLLYQRWHKTPPLLQSKIEKRAARFSVESLLAFREAYQGLSSTYKDILKEYWQQTISRLETDTSEYKLHPLPLERIRKVMKRDPEAKIISATAEEQFVETLWADPQHPAHAHLSQR